MLLLPWLLSNCHFGGRISALAVFVERPSVGGRQRRIDLAEIVVIRSVLVACFPIAYPPSGLTARGMAHYVHIALGEAIDPIFLGRVRVGAIDVGRSSTRDGNNNRP